MRSHSRFLAALLLAAPAAAQIEAEGTPAAILADLRTELVPVEFVQPPDVAAYLAEDAARTEPGPLRYGALLPVDINPADSGVWDELADGTLVWRFKVQSPGAKSIGLEFRDFWLPDGASIYLYDETLETVRGAYTSVNNQPTDQLQFAPFPGESLVFEYVQPADVRESARLDLGTVIYDYRDVMSIELDPFGGGQGSGGQGGSGAGQCLINVNCPEGDPWEQQKRATVRTFSGGGLCSGALINNTAIDATQYVYSAWHCGQGTTTVFSFNYQTATCNGGAAPSNQTVSGATNLVNYQQSDGRLLRINNQIPAAYLPFFAGWRRNSTNPTLAMSMNHPGGGPKKIAIDNNGASKTTVNFQGIGAVQVWRCGWNIGSSQGGSSGGPLFDANGRMIGTLTGGPGGTCPSTTYFGRLDVFWNNVNVAQYLDPTGSGVTSMNGFDPYGGGPGSFPVITNTVPSAIQTVMPNSPVTVVVTGSGFTGLDSVDVDGTPVAPADFTIVDDTQVTVLLHPPYKVGIYTIDLVKAPIAATTTVGSSFALTAPIDLVDSDPAFLSSGTPAEIYMGGFPLDTIYLVGSLSNVPSSFPGIAEVAIGNNGLELVLIGVYSVDPLLGYAKADVFLPLPSSTKVYFQAGALSAIFGTFPLTMSNVETGTIF